MKRSIRMMSVLAVLAASSLCAASSAGMGEIYQNRCANCHGMKADGVSMMHEMPGTRSDEAAEKGMASQEHANIHGPALNHMSQDELHKKLMDFRSKGFESDSYHSVMRTNLKTIENREGEVNDAAMAAYIYNTFGGGAN